MHVHFIGIGGIGMSALAQYYLTKGHKVSGSDLVSSEITEMLKKRGADIFITNPRLKTKNPKLQSKIQNANLVIYTPAINRNYRELQTAKGYKIKTLSYPQALGELTKQYFTIAVCGTHGKSTTTAMLALILIRAGLNPTVILGTKLREFGDSNFRIGGIPKSKILNLKSEVLVIEADEHFASFLHYWPKMIVLTNIEEDHLDYYKNLKNIIWAFRIFIGHLPKNGTLVVNSGDKNSKFKIQDSKLRLKIENYALQQKETKTMRRILQVPGKHNVENALAALGAARALKIPDKISFKVFSEYRGSWRRFQELKIKNCKFKIVSDYAHHPTEIKATIRAAEERFSGKKIWVVFQPHQIARTVALFDDFIKAFDEADALVLTNIFEVAGREEKKPPRGKDVKTMTAKIKKRNPQTYFVPNFRKIPQFLKKKAGRGDVILIMGAGDIYQIASPEYWQK